MHHDNFIEKCFLLALLLVVMLACPLSAAAAAEEPVPEAFTEATMEVWPVTVKMAVLRGPSGFGFVHLLGDGGRITEAITVQGEVLPSPNEAVARLVSGELQLAALPATTAAVLHNRGVPVHVAAITGEGNLFFLARDPQAEFTPETMRRIAASGRHVHVPAPGSTPDLLTRYLLESWGMPGDEVDALLDRSIAAPAQLAQLLIAGRAEYAVLPEPFAAMAIAASDGTAEPIRRAASLQKAWKAAAGSETYPMTVLVVRDDFAAAYPRALQRILAAISSSIFRVNTDPAEAAQLIERFDIMSAAMAETAIPSCALVFRTAQDARTDYLRYLAVIAAADPAAAGGRLPDETFFTGP